MRDLSGSLIPETIFPWIALACSQADTRYLTFLLAIYHSGRLDACFFFCVEESSEYDMEGMKRTMCKWDEDGETWRQDDGPLPATLQYVLGFPSKTSLARVEWLIETYNQEICQINHVPPLFLTLGPQFTVANVTYSPLFPLL